MPRGFAKDHPAAHYLQFRQFMAFREEPAAFAHAEGLLYSSCAGTLETIMPLVRFLNEPLIDASARRRAHLLADELDIA